MVGGAHADVSEEFHHHRGRAQGQGHRGEPGPQNTAVARLWVPAVSAVLKIDLVSVTYADGSSRIFFSRENCRVTPDPLMLISTR